MKIDYLKLDIEYSEWPALEEMLFDNSIRNVKQIGIEIHTREVIRKDRSGNKFSTTKQQFERYYKILKQLEDVGFRRWSVHNNQFGMYDSPRTGKRMTCCYEMSYINVKYNQQW